MKFSRRPPIAVTAAMLALMPLFAVAGGSSQTAVEIQHLLQFVGDSERIFVRNGDEDPAPEARDHMEMKYGYGKGRIKTAEQFIQHIATRSSITRKPYLARCAGYEVPSAEWLTDELQRYRDQASSSAMCASGPVSVPRMLRNG